MQSVWIVICSFFDLKNKRILTSWWFQLLNKIQIFEKYNYHSQSVAFGTWVSSFTWNRRVDAMKLVIPHWKNVFLADSLTKTTSHFLGFKNCHKKVKVKVDFYKALLSLVQGHKEPDKKQVSNLL